MKFSLEGLDVFFPYDYIYPEQFNYMLELKRALDAKGHALLEMPTGTGKTVCLISLITSYQLAHPECGKLIYCTRTVPEMVKCMEEIKRVINFRKSVLGPDGGKVMAICLSSRRNMCVHPRAEEEGDREAVDSICRSMTASWVRQKAQSSHDSENLQLCNFFETYDKHGSNSAIPLGIYTLEEIKDIGRQKGWCPYFLTRQLIHSANIIVYNYQYMLDPKVASLVSRELESESIVVFDEAHNIDNVCIEALSVTLDKKALDSSSRSVQRLQTKVAEMKATDTARLNEEYQQLVRGLQQSNPAVSSLSAMADSTGFLGNPSLPSDVLQEAVPGNIRRAEHFLTFLKKIVEYLKKRLKSNNVEIETPLKFLRDLNTITALEMKPLRFTYSRLNSLLRTLEVTSLEDFTSLSDVANFATLVSTYLEGFSVVTEPMGSVVAGIQEPLLQLACLDASLALKPVVERFKSVIITSGTLSPIDLYPKILNFQPVVRASLPMSTFRPCLLPLVVTRGSDQIPISTRFEQRKDPSVIRNYGQLLLDVVSVVPDGVCCFFTSYMFMEYVVGMWDQMRILQKVMEKKLIYLETKDVVETTLALDNYKRSCDNGRGAVFLSVARGKVAEGIDFDRHYGRCVILFGVPYQYTLSYVLRCRLDYMRSKYQIKDNDFLTFDAIRQSAQCIGRVIRSKTDYGLVVLADSRFNRHDKRSKLPPWVLQFLQDQCLNLSTDVAVEQMKTFLRQMGQPIDKSALHSILLTAQQVNERQMRVEGEGWADPYKKVPKHISLNNNNSINDDNNGREEGIAEEKNNDMTRLGSEGLQESLEINAITDMDVCEETSASALSAPVSSVNQFNNSIY